MIAHLGPESLDRLLLRKQVGENRDVFCSEYERCLDAALGSKWVSWTCAHCLRFAARRSHGRAAIARPAAMIAHPA